MGFKIIQKHANSKNASDLMVIGPTQTKIPQNVANSVGNMVIIMIDEDAHRIAIRSTDDDDGNGYLINRYGVINCNAIRREAASAGLTLPAPVFITFDAELDAWVADLMIPE